MRKEQKAQEKMVKQQSSEDAKIVKQVKNKKRDKRRERAAKDEDHFENLFKTYQSKILKNLGKGSKDEGPAFEEVVMSD